MKVTVFYLVFVLLTWFCSDKKPKESFDKANIDDKKKEESSKEEAKNVSGSFLKDEYKAQIENQKPQTVTLTDDENDNFVNNILLEYDKCIEDSDTCPKGFFLCYKPTPGTSFYDKRDSNGNVVLAPLGEGQYAVMVSKNKEKSINIDCSNISGEKKELSLARIKKPKQQKRDKGNEEDDEKDALLEKRRAELFKKMISKYEDKSESELSAMIEALLEDFKNSISGN